MKKLALCLITFALTACGASMKREAYVSGSADQNITTEQSDNITKVVYSKKYYDSAIKIDAGNAAEKLGGAKLPTPVLISGTVKDSVSYKDRAGIGKLRGINWLGGEEYKGAYVFNGKNLLIAKFPAGSKDFQNGANNVEAYSQIADLFCIASEAAGDDLKLMTQDLVWFSIGKKEKLAPLATRTNKTADGKPIYIDFKDCAFVKYEQ